MSVLHCKGSDILHTACLSVSNRPCHACIAVVRKQQATVDEMQAVVGMQLLEIVLILTRSHNNRQRLISFGFLPVLAQGLKVQPVTFSLDAALPVG